VGPVWRMAPVYTRPANTTRPAIAASVSAVARAGSHQEVTPKATRPGMANGAVTGKIEISWDRPLSGSFPTAMNEPQ
jgi:hypothetical protein